MKKGGGVIERMIWIGLAGALGTVARHGLSGAVQRLSGAGFPWGTLAVNVIGCFLFGLVWSLVESRPAVSAEMRSLIFIGFLGAFTTFSSFTYETSELVRGAQWLAAAGNVLAQNGLGLVALFGGLALGRGL